MAIEVEEWVELLGYADPSEPIVFKDVTGDEWSEWYETHPDTGYRWYLDELGTNSFDAPSMKILHFEADNNEPCIYPTDLIRFLDRDWGYWNHFFMGISIENDPKHYREYAFSMFGSTVEYVGNNTYHLVWKPRGDAFCEFVRNAHIVQTGS